MKRNSKKLLTLLLVGALCTATIGGVAAASAEETTTAGAKYALTQVFTKKNDATVGNENIDGQEKATAKFSFPKTTETDKDKLPAVELDRDLALKWYDKNGAKYLNFTFAIADENCQDVSFEIQTTPYQSVSEDKASNVLKITKDGKVYVNDEESTATVTLSGDVKVSLSEGTESGSFAVEVNGTKVGEFTNIGANYAENDGDDMDSFVMRATPVTGADETAIYLKSLNGQSFTNITDDKVEDDAPAVLIVNQEISHFLMGTAFNVDYTAIDVLKSSVTISSSDKKYYQYNPTDTEVSGTNITTSTYFMDTVYEKDGTMTSVWREEEKTNGEGREFVSVWFDLNDGTYSGEDGRYELAWYATDTVEQTVGTDTRKYIVLNRNEEGPEYTKISLDHENKENVVDSSLEELVEAYNAKLEEIAADKYAGSNEKVDLPAVDWLITDNNGYNALSFTISYKTPASTSASSATNKKYNSLQITTATEGWYEFKIFASDSANNAMKYYLDGELVEVSADNVWEIEEIPTFKFKLENKGIKTKEDADKNTLDSQILDESYTMSKVSIVGASNEQSAYKLYKIDNALWGIPGIAKVMATIKYAELNTKADEITKGKNYVDSDDFMAAYLQAFQELLIEKINADEDCSKYYQELAAETENFNIANMFKEINVYDSDLDDDEGDNIYNWSATSRRFTAAEEGLYLILADYWDEDLSMIDRVPAYKLIEVSEETDTIKGVSEWLQNNLVSLILFGVAGVFAIALLVLIFVKPSNETLEDVDKKAKSKK